MQSRQNDQGGLGLWASSPDTAEFPTVYAAHFLIEARERGQQIPAGMLENINSWLGRFASTPASTLSAGRMRAYAVYLLTRQGIRSPAALSNVEQELTRRYPQTWQNDLAAAYLASTYRLMQRNLDADKIIANLKWSGEKRDWESDIYYDALTHDSEYLYLLARHFPERLNKLPPNMFGEHRRWVSGGNVNSLSASYTLLALDAYAKAAVVNLKLSITEIGKDGRRARSSLCQPAPLPKVGSRKVPARVQFRREGQLPAFYARQRNGIRSEPTSCRSESRSRDHSGVPRSEGERRCLVRRLVKSFWYRFDCGRRNWKTCRKSRLWTSCLAVLNLCSSCSRRPTPARVSILRPLLDVVPGFSRLPIGLPEKSNWTPYHIDVRDDRIVLYGDVGRDARTFVYRVRATNAGVFQAPPPFAEGMYDRKIAGSGLAGKLEIVKP